MKFPHIRCNKKFSKTLSLGVLCAAAAGSSMAAGTSDQSGFYLGSGIGYSTISPTLENAGPQKRVDDHFSQKKHDTGFKLYGGYQFNENWALEAQYINLGKYKGEPAREPKNVAGGTVKASGIAVNGVGSYHFNEDFSIFAKAGVIQLKLDAEFFGPSRRASGSGTSTLPLLGIGAEYRLTPQLSLRAEYEYYGEQKIGQFVKIRTDMATLGLRYRF